jgi:sec-independent protein translocase protein TatA
MFDGAFSPWHLIIVVIIFMALFGYKRLPDASKSLARSMRIFKAEMKNFHDDDTPAPTAAAVAPPLPVAAPVAPVAPVVPVAPAPVTPVATTEHAGVADHAPTS